MPGSFNGFGSNFYGKCQWRDADDTYVTTEWFVMLYVPIAPLRSLRVSRDIAGDGGFLGFHKFGYDVIEELPINWSQVRRVYLFVSSVALWYWWLLNKGLDAMGYFEGKESLAKFFLVVFFVVAPWLILWFLRRGAKKHTTHG